MRPVGLADGACAAGACANAAVRFSVSAAVMAAIVIVVRSVMSRLLCPAALAVACRWLITQHLPAGVRLPAVRPGAGDCRLQSCAACLRTRGPTPRAREW